MPRYLHFTDKELDGPLCPQGHKTTMKMQNERVQGPWCPTCMPIVIPDDYTLGTDGRWYPPEEQRVNA